MKALILAAGFGKRLMPLTKNNPKCMVEYKNKKIIDYIFEALKENNIHEIAVVGGYLSNVLHDYLKSKHKIKYFYKNEEFSTTNMVYTLFSALDFMKLCIEEKSDLIISYSDIVYFKNTIKAILDSNYEISIVVDKKWKALWSERFSNPLEDAESLKIENNKIIQIGKKTNNYNDIQGQYIGLVKISHKFLENFIDYYYRLDRNKFYDGVSFNNMYMTSFIQELIDKFNNVFAIEIFGNWIEIDSINDLQIDLK